jgi:hypothetical protein
MGTVAQAILSPGPFGQLMGFRDCLCPDGKRRAVRCGIPDTMSTAPARIATRIKGKSVSGFVSTFETETGECDAEFIPMGKHRDIFGRWKSGHLLPESVPVGSESEWYWARSLGCWSNTSDHRVMDEDGTVYAWYSDLARVRSSREAS